MRKCGTALSAYRRGVIIARRLPYNNGMREGYDDEKMADDKQVAAMNREFAAKRARESVLDGSPDIAAPCREYAAVLTFCLDYCSNDREREVLGAAADALIRLGGTPASPPANAYSRSPLEQVKSCAIGICRLARIASAREGGGRAALSLLIAATELLTL